MSNDADALVTHGDLVSQQIWAASIAKALIKKGVLTKQELIDELDIFGKALSFTHVIGDIGAMKATVKKW